jgi:hypothetical protein
LLTIFLFLKNAFLLILNKTHNFDEYIIYHLHQFVSYLHLLSQKSLHIFQLFLYFHLLLMKEESMEEEELDRDRECVFVTSPFWKKKN